MSVLKRTVKGVGRYLGYDLRVQPTGGRKINSMSYGAVSVGAQYSPWLDDPEFARVMTAIEKNTLVDRFRCFELWQIVAQVVHLLGDILEVGVWRGGTGALLAVRAPSKTVYLADTFAGVVKVGLHDADYRGGEHADTSVDIVRAVLDNLGATNARLLVGVFPDDIRPLPERYCFVHIDVDAYDSADGVMQSIWPSLSVGGVVVFDDYGFDTTSGIARLVNTYRGSPDRVVVHNLNGHAVIVKTA